MVDTEKKDVIYREDFNNNADEQRKKLHKYQQESLNKKRLIPTKEAIYLRKKRIHFLKKALPIISIFFFVIIVAWPEFTHLIYQDKTIMKELGKRKLEVGHIEQAVYRDITDHNQQYMITSKSAHQIDDDTIDLFFPKADIFIHDNDWLYAKADHGLYLQNEENLNLDDHVVFYRNDGTLVNTPYADINVKKEITSLPKWVHGEGPHGVFDAMGGFYDHKRGIVQFIGPGHTTIFNDRPSQ